MRVLVVDTWAFVEMAFEGPRRDEVEAVLDEADALLTTREVVSEAFTFIARRSGATKEATAWLSALRASAVRVAEPPLGDVAALAGGLKKNSKLSFADLSVAAAAKDEGTVEIATEDAEFRSLGLRPLFAKR